MVWVFLAIVFVAMSAENIFEAWLKHRVEIEREKNRNNKLS
jgi:hypothetical protein